MKYTGQPGVVMMFALTASVILLARSAVLAADLGGNCCADLEERIAELEATTARKGNRKVSLTVTGYVAQEITFWDDGGQSDAYLHGLGPTQATNVRFSGQAQISPGWTAGYMLRLQNLDDNPFGRDAATGAAMNQFSSKFSQPINVQMSYWFLQSKDLGKIGLGRQANAAKSAAMFTDQSGTQVFDNYTFLDGFPQFIIRSGGNLTPPITWGQLGFCYSQNFPLGGDCNGIVMNAVRYDTPVFMGFSASASWGEDDVWEAAARYAGELGGFKLSLGAGYSKSTDELTTGPAFTLHKDSEVFQAGGYIQHLSTGLFAHAAYGQENNNDAVIAANGKIAPDSHHWYVKGGIRQKWTSLGATVVYGDYAAYIDQLGPVALGLGATGGTLTRYGAGIAQEIDAAAMTVYLKYQHYDADISGAKLNPAVTDLDSLDLISAGAIINF